MDKRLHAILINFFGGGGRVILLVCIKYK